MDAQTLIQWKIEAEQLLDDITYAIRSIETCGGAWHCTGVHAGQLVRGCEAAALFLDSTGAAVQHTAGGHGTLVKLREAKKIAAETLRETKQAAKDYGFKSVVQLRLALKAETADTHEYALGA